jgi:hypothetical protein
MMKDFDEKTIWTSDILPLMASYHKGSVKGFLSCTTFSIFFGWICIYLFLCREISAFCLASRWCNLPRSNG